MENYIGEIRAFGGNYAPEGWALCNGNSLSISENSTLYALIGTTYGGDGVTYFNLPNLCGRVPVGTGQGTGLPTNYTLGQTAGTENVTLKVENLPSHSHNFMASNVDATTNIPANNYLAAPVDTSAHNANLGLYLPQSTTPLVIDTIDPNSISSTGNNLPHENLMPYLTINYIIALTGIFPQQA